MSDTSTSPQTVWQQNRWLIGLAIGLLLVIVLIISVALGARQRPLKPFVPTETPAPLTLEAVPQTIPFALLGEDPAQYRDQLIRVSGTFRFSGSSKCPTVYSGPRIIWGVINDDLQMNALGLESIARRLPDGLEVTVEGIWRFHAGPVGCGKEAQAAAGIWYLEVLAIVQPNPLPLRGPNDPIGTRPPTTPLPTLEPGSEPGSDPLGGIGITPIAVTPGVTPIPLTTPTPTPDPLLTPTPTETAVLDGTSTPTPFGGSGTPTATPTPSAGSGTPTATPTATPTSLILPTPTDSGGNPPPPPAATATPGSGYPGPLPTSPPGSYP